MASKTLYPHSLSQSSGNNIQSFNNLANLKNANNTYAKTNKIAKKSGTCKTPAAITAKNFKANLPAGSKINKVAVEYAADTEGNISIGKPTLDILKIAGDNKKGKALTKTLTKTIVTWTGDHYVSNMNHADFGVKISFPANTKNEEGYVKLKYIRIIIDYTPPNFSVSGKLAGPSYAGEETLVQLTLSNVNKTKLGSNVDITLGENVDFIEKSSGSGSISVPAGSGKNFTWITGIGSSSSVSVVICVRTHIPLGGSYAPCEIEFSEIASGHSGSMTWDSYPRPPGEITPDIPDDTPETQTVTDPDAAPVETPVVIKQVEVNEEFDMDLSFPGYSSNFVTMYACLVKENGFDSTIQEWEGWSTENCTEDMYIYLSRNHQWYWSKICIREGQGYSPLNYVLDNMVMQNKFKCTTPGEYIVVIYDYNDSTNILKKIHLSVKPSASSLTVPNFAAMKLGSEEINRLGHGVSYSVQSFIKLITEGIYVRDWGKNFRIGVFNNRIESSIITIASFGSFSNDSVTATLNLPVTFAGYTVTSSVEVDTTESASSIVFTKAEDNNNVIVEVAFHDSNEEVIFTGEYEIDFENESVTLVENEYDPTDYDNISDETIINNAEYWSIPLSTVDAFESLECNFPYNKNYPVYVLTTGDYPEGNISDNDVKFTEPGVIESATYKGYEPNGQFPVPILNLVSNEDSSDLTINMFESGNCMVFYDLPLGDDFGVTDTFGISGIELTGDIDYSDHLVISAKLMNSNGKIGERSIIVNDVDSESENESFSIGGEYDLWGFNISDMTNIEDWSIQLEVNNIFNNADDIGEIKFKNVQLTIYSTTIKSNFLKVTVENENVRHLGMFVQKVKIPEGLLTDTKYITIDGTDTNDAYRMNVKGKEIEIEFSIRGCNLLETTELLRQLSRLFVNERDELNNPIEKRIEFSIYPDVYFMYIMEDPFDVDPQVTDYTSKVKLTIPSGTAFAKEETVTGYSGVNKGIAKVSPIINIVPTGDIVEIVETVNDQKFKINYTEWSSSNTVQIDCVNRKIKIIDYLNPETNIIEEKDISFAGDLNNDWFTINKEYAFTGDNCIIQTVSFTERY
ncbi:hypothetical protein [Methanobrevibacter sp.]|uniref:hypothetical protein n=1 Tax=Methanobrevibacter sp. TaxID=66852 RepID=UPI0038693365